MKLLLTSAGFINKAVSNVFLEQIQKPADQIKVVFIPTASRTEEELAYVDQSKQELIELGIQDITVLNLDHQLSPDEVFDCDVVYVCGGNTFYLLKKVCESGFDKLLKNYSGLYVGVSAGSIIVGPDIKVAAPWDENDVNLTDTIGLGLVDFAVCPHYQRKEKEIIERLKTDSVFEIVPLTDQQAVLVTEKGGRIIE